ncbi:MAG: (2Fe-2S)-binding protein [Gammaproteobacteria bacterium]|nr:(2Fe-2S)-binding protein [Gammaproteobacteria bacterium]
MKQSIEIDGVRIPFEEGQTIMDAALQARIYIPHLCHHPDFDPIGSCRLCVVKVNQRFVSSCTAQAEDGLVVDNKSAELMDKRRSLLKLLFIEGNHICPACEKSGACTLQAVAYHCELLAPELSHLNPKRLVDASHAAITIDYNRCIACGLCVKASAEKDKKSVFTLGGRGTKTQLMLNSSSGKLVDTNISVNDVAIKVCPVGVFLSKHQAYETPIGQRLYDKVSIKQLFTKEKSSENKS